MSDSLAIDAVPTAAQIRDLRADVLTEWHARGFRSAWPEGEAILASAQLTLDPKSPPGDPLGRRRAEAMARVAQAIEERTTRATQATEDIITDEAAPTGILGDVAIRSASVGSLRDRDRDVDSLVLDASRRRLPPCRKCGVASGDPCRRPSGRTTPPHAGRVLDEIGTPDVMAPPDRSPLRNAGRSYAGDARVPYYPRDERTEIAQHLRLTASRFLSGRATAGDVDEAARMWTSATSHAATPKCDQ